MSDRSPEMRKRVTIKDVAKAAGVSPGLVSIVFNDIPGASDANRTRVRQAARDLGYQPDFRASLLRRRHARLLGVSFFVQSAFHGDLLPGIYAAAEAAGYEVALSGWTAERSEEHAIRALIGFRCDALILLGPEVPEPVLADVARDLPIVVIGRRLTRPIGVSIHTDDGIGMRLAVEHLVSLGHRAIAHVDGGVNNVKGDDRVAGYRAAMEALGLADLIRVIPGGQTVEAGGEAAARLLAERGPETAVVAFDDDLAWGMMAAFQGSTLSVPGDLSIVGYDGSRLSRIVPLSGMTTVRQDAEGLAALAVERAVGRVQGEGSDPAEVVLSPTLTIGSSAASLDR
jgi:DNA-binding LacI/PurR family transcriptional regulator